MVTAYIDAIFEYHYFLEFLTKKKDDVVFLGVAQLVEHHLAKVDVEGSNPFARSNFLVVGKQSGNFIP